MRKEICILMTLVLAFSMISLVSAGVGYPYFEKNAITMAPGESKDLVFTLSNSEAKSKLFQASVVNGGEIVSFAKSDYIVATGSSANADLRIKVPSDAVDGQEYAFTVNFAEGPADSVQSGISLGVAAEIGFKVVVKKSEVEKTAIGPEQMWMIAGIVIVILAIVIWLSLGKKKKRR